MPTIGPLVTGRLRGAEVYTPRLPLRARLVGAIEGTVPRLGSCCNDDDDRDLGASSSRLEFVVTSLTALLRLEAVLIVGVRPGRV